MDYWKILGLNEGASLDEIKKSYRELAKKYHPDHNTSPDAEKKFCEIQEAYEYLKNNPDYKSPDSYSYSQNNSFYDRNWSSSSSYNNSDNYYEEDDEDDEDDDYEEENSYEDEYYKSSYEENDEEDEYYEDSYEEESTENFYDRYRYYYSSPESSYVDQSNNTSTSEKIAIGCLITLAIIVASPFIFIFCVAITILKNALF